jgi:DNA-binding NarL/FixJ family response regulator
VIRLSKRILIVDDNDVARNLIKEAIASHADWQICGEALDGKDAIQKAVSLKPDLIVMDMAMPVMDGLQASKEILKALPAVPIVLNTMHTGEQVDIAAQGMGIRKVVSKMAGPGELESILEKLLNAEQERSVGAAVGGGGGELASQLPIAITLAEASAAPQPPVDAPQTLPPEISAAPNDAQASPPKPQ